MNILGIIFVIYVAAGFVYFVFYLGVPPVVSFFLWIYEKLPKFPKFSDCMCCEKNVWGRG